MSTDATPAGGPPETAGPLGWSVHPATWFVARRLGGAAISLLLASILIFASVQLLPGNVGEVVLGRNGTPQQVAALDARTGLDQPFPDRYAHWLSGFLEGNLGVSTVAVAQGSTGSSASVWNDIRLPLFNSAVLALVTILILIPLSLVLGTVAAVGASRWYDHTISVSSLTLGAMPEFLTGTFVILIFFTALGLLPAVSILPIGATVLSRPEALVLPVITLLCVNVAWATRLIRASTIEVLSQDYVTVARLNGVNEKRVIMRYGVRNALAPTVQVFAQTMLYLLGGIIVVESVFGYPGIGSKLVTAVSTRDVQEIMDIAMLLAAIYMVINIIADFLVIILVPRLRSRW